MLHRLAFTITLVVFTLATHAPPAAGAPPEPFLDGLEFPTNMAFAPDGRLFFTEKSTGNVRIVRDGRLREQPFVTLPVVPDAERGLLGIAIPPDFPQDPWVYLYLSDGSDGVNRLIRVAAAGNRAGEQEVLLNGLDSSAGYHNGGDLAFAIDGTLFATLGEAHDPDRAQRLGDLGGKVVRLNADGSIPADNPFGGDSPVWSYGHRNSFGICVDPANGQLWETENGPDRNDEVNRIARGGNHGWPEVVGRGGDGDLVDPVVVFPRPIAVTGCAVLDGDLYFGSFDGRLWRLPTTMRASSEAVEVAQLDTGVTDVVLGPDGLLYIATADAILRMRVGGEPSPSASPSISTPAATPSASPSASEAGGGGLPPWITVAAALAVAAGLGLRFAAGRRLRKQR